MVAGGLDPPHVVAGRHRPGRRRRGRPDHGGRRRGGPDRHPRRQVAGQGLDEGRAVTVEISGPAALVAAAEGAAADLRRAGKITGELVFTPDESAQQLSVAAEVATAAE